MPVKAEYTFWGRMTLPHLLCARLKDWRCNGKIEQRGGTLVTSRPRHCRRPKPNARGSGCLAFLPLARV